MIQTNAGGCTSGFEWHDSSSRYMISAGHCAERGGSVSTPAQAMGYFGGWTWQAGVGTIAYNGDYHGDVSYTVINYPSVSNGPKIYSGGVNSSTSRYVNAMWSRSPQIGDMFCSGGSSSGEQCGWRTVAYGNYYYSGTGETCLYCYWTDWESNIIRPGDSGGPVYTIDSNGYAIAKGIISGSSSGICVYTDIWDAYYAFPGYLLTGP